MTEPKAHIIEVARYSDGTLHAEVAHERPTIGEADDRARRSLTDPEILATFVISEAPYVITTVTGQDVQTEIRYRLATEHWCRADGHVDGIVRSLSESPWGSA